MKETGSVHNYSALASKNDGAPKSTGTPQSAYGITFWHTLRKLRREIGSAQGQNLTAHLESADTRHGADRGKEQKHLSGVVERRVNGYLSTGTVGMLDMRIRVLYMLTKPHH